MSKDLKTFNFTVLDLNFNRSDHNPVSCKFNCEINVSCSSNAGQHSSVHIHTNDLLHLRWDKANLSVYKDLTGQNLQEIYNVLSSVHNFVFSSIDTTERHINSVYVKIIEILYLCAEQTAT